jgi:AraC family mar-sox-rob regulon transcriptional activator
MEQTHTHDIHPHASASLLQALAHHTHTHSDRDAASSPAATRSPTQFAATTAADFTGSDRSDEASPPPDKQRYFPLSRTTDRVLRILLSGDLARVRAESVAESLGMSCTTLRRRLRADHTNYQFLLDRARQYRCEQVLREQWRPGKCLAVELGYLEVNSFYRAFRRWTGVNYSEYKLRYCC